MKLFKILIILILAIIVGVGVYFLCFNENTKIINKKQMTAEEVVQKLKEKCPNIGEIVVYNEETDPNEKLGRPNQYTSKANFADTRLEQNEKTSMEDLNNEEYTQNMTEEEKKVYIQSNNSPTGGMVEVFLNKEDAKSRKDYIEALNSVSTQYCYLIDCTLLRIEGNLTPTQAQEYETAFNEIMK